MLLQSPNHIQLHVQQVQKCAHSPLQQQFIIATVLLQAQSKYDYITNYIIVN